MSGVFGLFNLDGAPVAEGELRSMASLLSRRGPDGSGAWSAGPVGLGHTLLATTPEALLERLPLEDAGSGCVITADVRLDNREELARALGVTERAAVPGDAGLVLAAYLAWGTACVERFLGDFAFALWDPRERRLFCARDHFGMRPFYYHHAVGRFLAFASEPDAILVLPQAPCRVDEGRIADVLVSQLEGVDKTSTFFEEVYRLPPAHTLTATPDGIHVRRYWAPQPGGELRLESDEAYAEAFLEVFTEAVRCRLRGAGPVGSMLSGGLDSGAVVAVARKLLAGSGRGPLPTVSAVGPDAGTCVETRAIRAALTVDGLDPCTVSFDELGELMPELEELTWSSDEPFDGGMTLVRATYLAARRRGLKVLLDGVAGDMVLSEGHYLARLLRGGRWPTALRECFRQGRFWGEGYRPWQELEGAARLAFVPDAARRLRRRLQGGRLERKRLERNLRESVIRPDFARRVDLAARLRRLDAYRPQHLLRDPREERAMAVDHTYLTVGRERYGRVASAVGVEPRDPFLDLRVVSFCLSLPEGQMLSDGWPKVILRRAMKGLMPDAVRWRRGKEHLGWAFTMALAGRASGNIRRELEEARPLVAPYVTPEAASRIGLALLDEACSDGFSELLDAAHLSVWLNRRSKRPGAEALE